METREVKNKEVLNNILVDDNLTESVKHEYRFLLATSLAETDFNNPFLLKTYDFDERFYQGKFWFVDPVTNTRKKGTPEEYGRRRLVAMLSRLELKDKCVLDLGAGTLNICRQLPDYARQSLLCFVNCDISGPWSVEGESSMELGARRAHTTSKVDSVVNVQYDFNSVNSWPFRESAFDYIVSCMAIHHVRFENKTRVLESIFRSLKPEGRFVIVDFFLKQDGGVKVTDAGQRGPEECSGYGQYLSDFLSLCQEVGFSTDKFCQNFILNKSFLTQDELEFAMSDISKTLQINKAIWFTVLSKGK